MMMPEATKFDRLLVVPPVLLLFVLPFAHVTALRSIAFVLTVAAAIYVWRKDPGPPVPLKLPIVLWAGMALLSLTWARDPAYTLGEIRAEIGYDVVYFLAFFALTRNERDWKVFRGTLLAVLAAMGSIALWVYAHAGDLNVDSYLGGVLPISTFLVTLFPLLLVAAFEFRADKRALAVIVLSAAAALLVGYFTFNRMFILAIVACSITVVLAFGRRHVPSLLRPRTLVLTAAILAVASTAFFVSVAQHRAGTGGVNATVKVTVENDPRWAAWNFSLGLIRQRPFSGVGFGLFAAKDLYRTKFAVGIERAITHAHNPFLNYAVQMGVGGVAALAFLLVCLFREFWKLWRSAELQVTLIGTAGMGMVIGVLVDAQTNDLWGRSSGYLFWALTGMMLGYAHRLLREPDRASGAGSP